MRSGSDFPYRFDLISPNYILLTYMVSSWPGGSSKPQAASINHQGKPNFFLDSFYKGSALPDTPQQPNLALPADGLASARPKLSFCFQPSKMVYFILRLLALGFACTLRVR